MKVPNKWFLGLRNAMTIWEARADFPSSRLGMVMIPHGGPHVQLNCQDHAEWECECEARVGVTILAAIPWLGPVGEAGDAKCRCRRARTSLRRCVAALMPVSQCVLVC